MLGAWVLNEIWITNLSSSLISMSSSKLFLFSKEVHFISGVRLLLELYCAVVIKHVAFFTVLAKLTVVLTCTSLPLNLYTSIFGCGCGFGFEQKLWRIDEFGEKKGTNRRISYPYSPPSFSFRTAFPGCLILSSPGATRDPGNEIVLTLGFFIRFKL